MRYNGFTKEDEARFIKLTEKGMSALFLYTNRLLHNGKRAVYNESERDERAIAISGKMYAPVSFFEKFLKVDTKPFSDKLVGGCLPVIECCRELGLSAVSLCESKLVVIGKEEELSVFSSDEALAAAGAYAVFGEYDASVFCDADYDVAARKYRDELVGNEKTNDLKNPNVIARIKTINERCAASISGLDRSGDPPILWGTKLLHDTDDGYEQYRFVLHMAKAYKTLGSDYYENPELLSDIKYALEWMYRHAFGEDVINGCGWRDPKLPNWWHWYVGAPEMLTDILLILYDEIPMEDRRRYLKCFVWITTWMCLGPAWAMSRLKIETKYAILLHDAKFMAQAQEDLDRSIDIKRPDYIDYSHQYPHNISYGAVIPERVLFVAALLAGTPLEFVSPSAYSLFYLVKYMFNPAMYKGQGFFMLGGRYTRQMVELNSGAAIISKLLPMLGMFGEDEDKYLKQFFKMHSVTERVRESVIAGASFVNLAKYEEILNDDSIPFEVDYEYSHSWYTGDRAAQHRNNYAFGIAMASKRHINYESILHENKMGWYTGDGAFHVYTSYDSNQYDGVNFMQNENIAYRFPGTTEDMQKRVARGISYDPWKAPNNFAGSIQIDNSFIAAGMEFISERCDGENENWYDEVRGWGRAKHENDLKCKKAWFCFDDEAVLLGAGITSTMNSPVNTTAAHRRIVKDAELSQSVKCAGKCEVLPKSEFEKRYENPDYFTWGGHAGYVFLDKTNLYVSRYNYTTNVEQPYLEVRIEHGVNPVGGSYAFAVLPYADEEKLEKYSKNPDVEILANTDKLQAVREKTLGVVGIVFYEAGEVSGVESDSGAVVMLKETDKGIELSVCDPTQEATELTLRVRGVKNPTVTEGKVSAAECDGYVEIKVNVEGVMGAPNRISLERV